MSEFNPCVVIPHYNHSDLLPGVIGKLQAFGLPILVVDDGSSQDHRDRVVQLCAEYPNVKMKSTNVNSGKGHAVMTGIRETFANGYTHAIQIDGDGQHDIEALSTLIAKAKEKPRDMVTGYPVYGEDIPSVRKYGRYITHFWVWVETLSFDIKDSMCGFRVYPVKECVALFSKVQLSPRMEFDTEVMVKLHWHGLEFQHLPVRVHYPEAGRSHFRYFTDNMRLIWAHTKMVLGMLVRAPKWLVFGRAKIDDDHWMTKPEAGTVLGLKLLVQIYTLLGRRFLSFILLFVSAYYYLFNSGTRNASKDYLARYRNYFGSEAQPVSTFWHIHQFAISVLDKLAVWRGDFELGDIQFPNKEMLQDLVNRKQGAVFLTSHFGNLEICRSWARAYPTVKLNAVFYVRNSKKFNSVLRSMSEDVNLNVFSPHEMTVETGILFKQKVEAGEWIFVMADRVLAGTQSRVVKSEFLGGTIELPMGPLAMAEIMDVPVFSMHCFKIKEKIYVDIVPLPTPPKELKRAEKFAILSKAYIGILERLVKTAPLQWFNFYRFWKVQ